MRASYTTWAIWMGGLLVLQVVALWLMGQPVMCTCGYIKFWEGVVLSSGNSQHLTDWYTFSHFIHGFLFYWLFSIMAPRLPVGTRLVLALGLEVSWELLENTPWVINAYRDQALAQGYTGDSILNSFSDSMFMLFGFAAARVLPVWGSIALALGLESTSLWFIRDGLTLNALNFMHHFDFIARWQSRS